MSIEADDLDLLSLSLDAEGLETDADGNPVVSFVTTLKEIRAVVDFCRSPAVDIAKLIFYFDSILGSPILLSSGSEYTCVSGGKQCSHACAQLRVGVPLAQLGRRE